MALSNSIDEREKSVMDFIQAREEQIAKEQQKKLLENNPEVKLNKLNAEYKEIPYQCIDQILGRLYKDALPYEDPKKNCDNDDAADAIHDFIAKRTGGKNSEYYVREAIKRTNSSTLKNLLAEAVAIAKEFYAEKAKDLATINLEDLRYNRSMSNDELDKITKKLEMDEIATIVQDNVAKAIQTEKDKVKKEDEYNKQIEDQLAADPNVDTEEKLEAAVEKIRKAHIPTLYQPSLFEALVTKNVRNFNESTMDSPIHEAVHEYTMFNIAKALKLESFGLNEIKQMANRFMKG